MASVLIDVFYILGVQQAVINLVAYDRHQKITIGKTEKNEFQFLKFGFVSFYEGDWIHFVFLAIA